MRYKDYVIKRGRDSADKFHQIEVKNSEMKQRIDSVNEILDSVDDSVAVQLSELYEEWRPNIDYPKGKRLRYTRGDKTILFRVSQPHRSQEGWDPISAVSLFAEILPGQDGTVPGEWVKPGSTNPYMTGDRVIYNGAVYESVIDGNLWSPEEYPAGWNLIE